MEQLPPIRLGVIGCGGFGLFALQQFAQEPGVVPVAMAGTHRPAALAAARRFGIPDVEEVSVLLARDDVDLVYIATPPFLHHPQALAALHAGKHVICEKPLAMNEHQAREMIDLAAQRNRLLVANLMQRYNPLFDMVRRLVQSQELGDVLHAYFENYASDEHLPADHWFWDRSLSGGIFVEHGVHFFDVFAGWFGKGQVVSAHATLRPGTDLEEAVQCTVRYPGGVLATFYHGFHQPSQLDRQEWRLVFERGDLRMHEWVPTRVEIRAIADEAGTRRLCELFPGSSLDVTAVCSGKQRACRGRGRELDVSQQFLLRWGDRQEKLPVYCELLRRMIRDQAAWVRDQAHQRVITEENGRSSLALAGAADRMAHSFVR